jgi:predicted nucleic acid-binding protein
VTVVEASAVLDGLLSATEHEHIACCSTGALTPLAAPDLLDVEVLSVLRPWQRRKAISTSRARQALADLDALPAIR